MPLSSNHTLEKEIGLNAVFNSFLIGIIIINENGSIEAINETAIKMFGYREEQLVGEPFAMLVTQPDKIKFGKYLTTYQNTPNTEHFEKHEIMVSDKHGRIFNVDLEFTDSVINDQRFFIGIIRDITQRKALEKEIEKQKVIKQQINEKLEKEMELGELKTRFVSMASHEFRTPLAGVLSSLQLVKRYLKAESDKWQTFTNRKKIETHFDKIEESVTNLNHILNDFLSLGKLAENNISCKFSKFNIHEFFDECRSELKHLCKSGQKIKVTHNGPSEDVYLDSHILRNIINNLLSNAIKYSHPHTTIILNSEIKDTSVTIKVKDEGIGIPLNEQKNLFKRFFRAGNAINYQGTGLGLSIVKKYVEIMDGSIDFESEENKGTSFYVTFPKREQ